MISSGSQRFYSGRISRKRCIFINFNIYANRSKVLTDKIKYVVRNLNKDISRIVIIFIAILFLGFAIGGIASTYIVSGLLKGKRYVLLLYRPPFEYLYTARLLYSSDELKRLEGYYSLLDNKIVDSDLLIDRYKQETEFIKPVIIWLLGYSNHKDAALKFISEKYFGADRRCRKEMLKTMKRLDEIYFMNFTASNKININ